MQLPRLYAILDRTPDSPLALAAIARELLAAGVTLIQYRNKQGTAAELLSDARELKRIASANVQQHEVRIIMNDRADIAIAAGLDGVHVGQDDLSVEGARVLLLLPKMVGVSTHNAAQLEAADATSADYIAFGPIFATGSKANPDPVVGLDGLRQARAKTKKPLVAIGGITLENCRQAIDAGADSVAVISALTKDPKRAAEEFLRRMM
jgi:thiamine-phosphate pyrophosphorylase